MLKGMTGQDQWRQEGHETKRLLNRVSTCMLSQEERNFRSDTVIYSH